MSSLIHGTIRTWLSVFTSRLSHSLSANTSLVAIPLGASLTAYLAFWCYNDYNDYLALGPGGPPYNILGWAGITLVARPFAMSKSGATLVSDYPEEGAHESIIRLPVRQGERALVGGIAPHRQLSQHAPEAMRQYITNLFLNAAKQHPKLLQVKKSLYERHHDALFISPALFSHGSNIPQTARTARGELGHAHPDLSVHLYLSPADARCLIEKCWAERHRLSAPKTALLKSRFAIADTYLMIYGPRDEGEMDVLRIILENSVRFMTAVDDVGKIEWKEAL